MSVGFGGRWGVASTHPISACCAAQVSANGMVWVSMLSGTLQVPQSSTPSNKTNPRMFHLEGVGSSRLVQFVAKSYYGKRAALRYIGLYGYRTPATG